MQCILITLFPHSSLKASQIHPHYPSKVLSVLFVSHWVYCTTHVPLDMRGHTQENEPLTRSHTLKENWCLSHWRSHYLTFSKKPVIAPLMLHSKYIFYHILLFCLIVSGLYIEARIKLADFIKYIQWQIVSWESLRSGINFTFSL